MKPTPAVPRSEPTYLDSLISLFSVEVNAPEGNVDFQQPLAIHFSDALLVTCPSRPRHSGSTWICTIITDACYHYSTRKGCHCCLWHSQWIIPPDYSRFMSEHWFHFPLPSLGHLCPFQNPHRRRVWLLAGHAHHRPPSYQGHRDGSLSHRWRRHQVPWQHDHSTHYPCSPNKRSGRPEMAALLRLTGHRFCWLHELRVVLEKWIWQALRVLHVPDDQRLRHGHWLCHDAHCPWVQRQEVLLSLRRWQRCFECHGMLSSFPSIIEWAFTVYPELYVVYGTDYLKYFTVSYTVCHVVSSAHWAHVVKKTTLL